MTALPETNIRVAVACGGTGGHIFPGLAVAEQLVQHGATVVLLVSPKEVDQQAVRTAAGMEILTLPAVGLSRGGVLAFITGFLRSYRTAKRLFSQNPPRAVLAMGGFTSAPPVLAAKRFGAQAFLHESNAIPGRANRWLSWIVDGAFTGFPCAASRLHSRHVAVTGTPVRPKFERRDAASCRVALGLNPIQPVALVTGGSQGASGLNDLVIRSLPLLAKVGPDWQWLHLAGPTDGEKLRKAYAAQQISATVHAFFDEMELATGAATAAISRAGASSLAELAAMRLPALLVPFPAATSDHQFYNARAFEDTGAARLMRQASARPDEVARVFGDLMCEANLRQKMQSALAQWHAPRAAEQIAQSILDSAKLGHPRVCAPDLPRDGRNPPSDLFVCRIAGINDFRVNPALPRTGRPALQVVHVEGGRR